MLDKSVDDHHLCDDNHASVSCNHLHAMKFPSILQFFGNVKADIPATYVNSYCLFCKYIYVHDDIHMNNILYNINIDIPLCMWICRYLWWFQFRMGAERFIVTFAYVCRPFDVGGHGKSVYMKLFWVDNDVRCRTVVCHCLHMINLCMHFVESMW